MDAGGSCLMLKEHTVECSGEEEGPFGSGLVQLVH